MGTTDSKADSTESIRTATLRFARESRHRRLKGKRNTGENIVLTELIPRHGKSKL